MDYEKMWERLWNEILGLPARGVQTIAPPVVVDYMDFIEQIEKERGEKLWQ